MYAWKPFAARQIAIAFSVPGKRRAGRAKCLVQGVEPVPMADIPPVSSPVTSPLAAREMPANSPESAVLS